MNIRKYFGALLMITSAGCVSGADTRVVAAQQDLAERLKIPVNTIEVVSQTEKNWPDGSLGCPRKGMMYKQMIINGSQLILSVADKQYFYHAAAGKPYFYCATPQKGFSPKKNGATTVAPSQKI